MLFVIGAFCATYYRTSLRRVRRNARDDIRREMALKGLETDHESLEWINSFLVKFWPIYAPVLCDTIIASVDQVLSTSTPAFLDSLRMKTFILGTKPPRLEHVKTYPKSEDDIVMMDWKFSFNPNDTADLTARQLKNKINPKVVLEVRVGKGLVSKGLDVIVEDFAFSGTMKVKVKLQIPFPHCERVEISFIGRPEIDYVCKPLGGDMFGFDINVIPGLEGFIQEMIHSNLAPMMYEPNVFPIEIAQMLSGNIDKAIGVVQITLHSAEGLKNPDKHPGIPDPYAQVSINGRDVLGKTETIQRTSTPRWNQTFNLIVSSLRDNIHIASYDWNEYRKDKDLGTALFALERLNDEHVHENLALEVMEGGRARGIIHADVRFYPVLEGEKDESGQPGPPPESNTGIAKFIVDQAKELDGSKSLIGQLNPYAVLLLNGKEVQISQKLKRTNNPIFPDATKELLITNRKTAKLGLVIKDDRDIAADPILGSYQIKIDDMLDLMAKGQEWYNLAGTSSGRAKMRLEWRPVALAGPSAVGGGYVTPVGVARIHIQSARDLRNVETVGKSDPYVRAVLSGVSKGRTTTYENNLDPDYDEVLYVPVHAEREVISIEVMDRQSRGSDRHLGSTEVKMTEYMHKGPDGEYLTHDEKSPIAAPLKLQGKDVPKGVLNFTCAFYPIVGVEEPKDETAELDDARGSTDIRKSSDVRKSVESRASLDKKAVNGTADEKAADVMKKLDAQEQTQGDVNDVQVSKVPKIKLTAESLDQYESGLIIFRLEESQLAAANCHVEVLIDDFIQPAYSSSRARSKTTNFNETGDAIIRELDVSRITLRLVQKVDTKGESGDGDEKHVFAKLTGQTLDVLKQGLYQTVPLTIKGEDGSTNVVHVNLRYLPIKMQLHPSESINNSGTLRVEVHDAADLPAADRNGYSDPYLKFHLNGKQVHKTETQKKTLHPVWNETFEIAVNSRTAAKFSVECFDWDRTDSDDLLGTSVIDISKLTPFQSEEVHLPLDGKSGTVRLKFLFKPDYVAKIRQGTTTRIGTFAEPGKVIGAPVKVIGKVGKGASFLTKGLRRSGTKKEADNPIPSIEEPVSNGTNPPSAAGRALDAGSITPSHRRQASMGAASISPSIAGGVGHGVGEFGTASFTIVSATGYEGEHVQISIKQTGPKGSKRVHESKKAKMAGEGAAHAFDEHSETFRVQCTADTQFTVHVKDAHTFGADKDLGDGMLVVSESGNAPTTVNAGQGTVVISSTFQPSGDAGSLISSVNSPGSRRNKFLGSVRGRDARSATPAE
ncbi:hypothetical protein FH972_022577 [Carpinus fangiana]|uniref:C2 domain-containing protein n=1 Tax=Carpinus fangiana TaxID=176857 RepID=A0A5N6KUW8_9ROSI|nr:hypothetical protein FH972_022577 [Carpinus fangiana]